MTTTTTELLAFLSRGGAWGYFWTKGDEKLTWWWPAGAPGEIPSVNADAYFGVNPTTIQSGRHRRATNETVAAINCLFGDIDAKAFGDGKAGARGYVEALDPPPSVVIDSGGGFHCYWLLRDPYQLTTDSKRARAREILARWVDYTGSDPGAKDLAHVLRVPGTQNLKPCYAPHFPTVEIVKADMGRLYNLDELEAMLPELETAPPPRAPSDGARDPRGRKYALAGLEREAERLAGTAPGGRNDQANRAAFALGQLVGAGALSRSEAEAALYDACVSNGLVRDDGAQSVAATLHSGLDAGEKDPREIPEGETPAQGAPERGSAGNTDGGGVADPQGKPQRLPTWPYAIEDGRIVYLKRQSDGEIVKIPVADFMARISHQVTTEHGQRHYRLEGEAVAGGPFVVEIKAEDFAETRYLIPSLDGAAGALDPVRSGMRRHVGPAIKLLSRDGEIEHWRRYDRVGWAGQRFVIPGRLGARVECVTDRCLPFTCPADADLERGIDALGHLLGALDPTVTAPVIGFMLLPAIARVAGLENERFGLFAVGRTGALKTSYMQAALACWGAGFLDDNALLKWGEGATRNAIMALATQATDAPLLIDNYKPGTGGGAEHFIALWHNIIEGGEKRRLSRAAELKATRPVWAWPIATGEGVPSDDAATLARMLVVEFEWERGQNNERLARAQLLAPHLPAVLGALLDWLEDGGREVAKAKGADFVELRQTHALRLLEIEAEAVNARRMGSSLAVLDIAWAILEAHPDLGPVFREHTTAFREGLDRIAIWQAHHSLEALEARQFLDGLRKLLDSGRLWLAEDRDMGTEEAQERRRGFVGWKDDEGGAYILPDAITQVKNLTGTRLNGVSDRTVYAQLAEIKALVGTHGNRNTYRVRVGPAGRERPHTLWLTTQALGEEC